LYGFYGGQCFDLIRLISASVTKYRVRGAVLRVAFVELERLKIETGVRRKRWY